MLVLEGLVDGFVEVTVVDLVGAHAGQCGGDLGELVAEVQTLLISALGCGGERGEFGVDLVQQFGQFVKVERAGLVLVVLFEEFVETTQVVGGLREALLHAVGDLSPFREGEVQLVRVFALLPGNGAQEGHNVVGDIVLESRAIANSVDITQRGSNNTQVGVCDQSMLVVLSFQLVGQLFTETGACCLGSITVSLKYTNNMTFSLTNTSGPETETHWNLLGHLLTVLHLCEEDLVFLNLLYAGVGQDINVVASKTSLFSH